MFRFFPFWSSKSHIFFLVVTFILIETFQHWQNARERVFFFSRIESKPGKINGYLKSTHRGKPGACRKWEKRLESYCKSEPLSVQGGAWNWIFFFPLIESMSCYKFKSLTEGRISVKTPKSQVQLFQIRKWLWVAPILGKPHTAQGFIGLIGYKYCNKPIRVGFQAAQTAVRVFMYICVGGRGFEGG